MPIPAYIKTIITNKSPTVKEVDISNWGLDDHDVEELYNLLDNNPYITSVNLERNNITSEGAETLSKLINLRRLNLRQNKITDRGVEKLLNNLNIQWLNLGYNSLTNESADLIITKLSQNKEGRGRLEFCNVTGNNKIAEEKLQHIDCLNLNKPHHSNITSKTSLETTKNSFSKEISFQFSLKEDVSDKSLSDKNLQELKEIMELIDANPKCKDYLIKDPDLLLKLRDAFIKEKSLVKKGFVA